MDQVLIRDLKVRTVIGINEEERSHLRELVINLVIFTDFARPGQSDEINDCINYATVVHRVKALVEGVARHTVEALSEDISQLCLGISGVNRVIVRVEKPDVVQSTRLVGVEIDRWRAANLDAHKVVTRSVLLNEHKGVKPETNKEWKIRPAAVDDIPALVDLRLGMFQSMGYTDPVELDQLRQDSYPYMVQKLPAGEFVAWVADVNGLVVGSGAVVIHSTPPTIHNRCGLRGYVMSVFTLPEWRKQGIARAIMMTILDYFRRKGITVATLRSTQQGLPLYLSLGFTPEYQILSLDIR